MRPDLQKHLVGYVIIRADEQLVQDLRKRTRLPVHIDWRQTGGHGPSRDLALHAAPGLFDERREQLACILQAQRGILRQADAAAPSRSALGELADRQRRDRRLLLAGDDARATSHGADRVEIDGQRGIQRIVGFRRVLDAGNSHVGWIIAGVEHDARQRGLADRADQLLCEWRKLLGNQEGIAAAAHIQNPLVIEVEARLEPVVAAERLERQPDGDEFGDGGRNERVIRILRDQLIALRIDDVDQRSRRQRRDLLPGASQGPHGQNEQGDDEQAKPHVGIPAMPLRNRKPHGRRECFRYFSPTRFTSANPAASIARWVLF